MPTFRLGLGPEPPRFMAALALASLVIARCRRVTTIGRLLQLIACFVFLYLPGAGATQCPHMCLEEVSRNLTAIFIALIGKMLGKTSGVQTDQQMRCTMLFAIFAFTAGFQAVSRSFAGAICWSSVSNQSFLMFAVSASRFSEPELVVQSRK
eukprot:s449_g2.t1